MDEVSHSYFWLNLIVISGTWGSSFALVKITEPMQPFTLAASCCFITMVALLAWLALRHRTPPTCYCPSLPPPSKADKLGAVDGVHYKASLHRAHGTLVTVPLTPSVVERS